MGENDVEENVFPTDWDGLAGYDDVMAGLPGMVQAESFSPSQTALFAAVTHDKQSLVQTTFDHGEQRGLGR